MKLAVILLAFVALASASYIKPTKEVKYFDKDMVYKQKFFLDILFKVWKPLNLPEYQKMGETFVYDKSYFTEYDKDMEYFYDVYKTHTFTPKGVTFTLFNKRFLKEVSGLFKFFYYAKDFETFQNNVCWARQYVNEGVFVYALQMFVMHSEHYKYIVLPPLYEIFPFYFFNGKFINTVKEFDYDFYKYEDVYEKEFFKYYETLEPYYKSYVKKFDWFNKKWHFLEEPKLYRDEYQMTEDFKFKDIFEGTKKFWVKADYAGKYDFMNEDYKLNYLTEDFDFNMFWYYFNMQYPFFLEGEKFQLDPRRGEYFLFVIQQILARYQLERYSHGFGEIDEFSWYTPVEHGYNPQLVAYNGLAYSYRPNNYWYVPSSKSYSVYDYADLIEEKFMNVIQQGYYETADGTKFYFNKPESINYIGLALQGSVDSIDRKFFSSFFFIYHTMLAYGDEYNLEGEYKYFDYMPNVMWNFATMMRDPLFYQVYTKVYKIYNLFKYQLPHYSEEELSFPGVKITDVHVDKLYTYFDIYDADVSTLVNKDYFFKDGKLIKNDYAFFGRRIRLNNKPFSIKYDFESDKPQKVVFRTFIGPKYDEHGKEMVFDYSREYFYEIDQFYYEASAGKNSYVRDSQHFFWTHKDFTTYFELYKYAFYASEGKYQFPVDIDMNKFCGFPERLILPRGWTDGMPMKIYVIVTPFDTSVKEYSYEHHDVVCGEDFDKLPYGFPLDRTIDMYKFWYPNMYYSDFYIYHLKDLHIPEELKTYFYDYHYYY